MNCEICHNQIGPDRSDGARTCSDECTVELQKRVRQERKWKSGPKSGFKHKIYYIQKTPMNRFILGYD